MTPNDYNDRLEVIDRVAEAYTRQLKGLPQWDLSAHERKEALKNMKLVGEILALIKNNPSCCSAPIDAILDVITVTLFAGTHAVPLYDKIAESTLSLLKATRKNG